MVKVAEAAAKPAKLAAKQVLAGQNPKLFSQKESDAKEAAKQAARKAAGEAGEKAASNSAKEYINKAKKAKKGFFPKDCKLSAKVEKEILSDAASAGKKAGQEGLCSNGCGKNWNENCNRCHHHRNQTMW